MLVYRIALTQYVTVLKASGRAARWNANEIEMIYTSANRSLACLENVVHRGKLGLEQVFSVMTIEINDQIKIDKMKSNDLPANWKDYAQMPATQILGKKWIDENKTAILEVPSSIIEEEVNYLINPKHPDFSLIKLIKTEPFKFDVRIKL